MASTALLQHFDTILVLDFGGQYCHLIARRIREQGVYSEIVPCDIAPETIIALQEKYNVKGLIFSGGPSSVYDKEAPIFHPQIFSLRLPVLGICYGHQLIAQFFGGKVAKGTRREYGVAYVSIENATGILEGLNAQEKVWMSHYDIVYNLPHDFETLAYTEDCPIAAFGHKNAPMYGLQWHPEVVHTERGMSILENFIFRICQCQSNWKPTSLVEDLIDNIKTEIQDKKAIIALSGGIDSSTATVLASKAIGRALTAVFVDHGFMREEEPAFVQETFRDLGVNLVIVDAKQRFLKKLRNVVDPETKRVTIGQEFIRVFEEIAEKEQAEYLIQGTIYPDRIESGIRKHSEKIKSHHNVSGIPTTMKFKAIIEPLQDLYKDEVREIAKSLGLPNAITHRQPFPGPGLAVRVMGEVTSERVRVLKMADRIVSDEIEKNATLKNQLWQYFAVLTDTKTTGVKGDSRAYSEVLGIRAVESQEAMTANFARIPYHILEKISTRITNEIPQISRVVYDITNKPPATIEWE